MNRAYIMRACIYHSLVSLADVDFTAYDLTSEVKTDPTGTNFVVAIFNLQRAV